MSIGKGEAAANATLGLLVNGGTLWVALFTDDGCAVEVASAGYARQPIAAWTMPSGGITTSTADVTFPAMADEVTVESAALMDAATGGAIVYGAAVTPTTVAVGIQPRFLSGALTVQES